MHSILTIYQIIRNMQWSDYLDILLVAFLIYKLLPMLRSAHIMRLARTVVAVVLISWITDAMRLHTLNWIINQVLAVGLLAFVVLFQPELRQMINHLGSVRLRNFFGTNRQAPEMEQVIAQTVMACENMSAGKIGALIVFERDHRLDEYFKTGTLIDGQVSDQLLRNIFFPKAALHDGACIIREGRVAAAGCVLPLTGNTQLSPDLGTRHRASVGVSEVSDAVVVVVSEETGTISVAQGGVLKRHLDPKTLEKILRTQLCPEQEEKGLSVETILGKLIGKDKEGRDVSEK